MQQNIKKTLILILLMGLVTGNSNAQGIKGQQEFALGAGIGSTYYLLENIFSIGNNRINYSSSGSYGLSYRYYLSRRFTLGVNVSYEHVSNHPILQPHTGMYATNFEGTFITVAPEMSLSYVDRVVGDKKVGIRMYWLVAWGPTIYHEKETNDPTYTKVYPLGFQITPFGIRVGKSLAGYAEAGFGYRGLINFGLSYKVPVRNKMDGHEQ